MFMAAIGLSNHIAYPIEVNSGFISCGENSCALDNIFGTSPSPGDPARISFAKDCDFCPIYIKKFSVVLNLS